MCKITGRSDDMLIIRGVNVFPTQIEELILKQPELSPHYLLEVSKDGPLDRLDVLVEIDPRLAGAGAARQQEEAKKLQHGIKAHVGISAQVKLLEPGGIARSLGKARRVVDKRPKETATLPKGAA
jgi:phenylacetate-CoA ligase